MNFQSALRPILFAILICFLNAAYGIPASDNKPQTQLPVVLRLNQIPQQTFSFGSPTSFPQHLELEKKKESFPAHEKTFFIPQHSIQEDRPDVNGAVAVSQDLKLGTTFQVFNGINDTGMHPADPILAAGPNQLMAAVNNSVAIFTKNGTKIFQTTFASWFSSLPDSRLGLFDPRVIYDQYSGHFIFLCAAAGGPNRSSVFLLSVSKTSDATGEWAFWTLDMQLNNSTHVNVFADFPGLGFDTEAIYVTGNIFNLPSFNYAYAKIRVLKKSEVYSFHRLKWHDFWNFSDATGSKAINVEPAQSFGPVSLGYLLSSNAIHGNKLTLWTITNPTGTPVLHQRAVPVSNYRLPPNAPQKGGATLINTGDAGLTNVVYAGGSLYAASSIQFDWGTGNVASIRFFNISTSGTVLQEITYGSRGNYYYYPVVMVDSQNNVAIAFNKSSTTTFAGIFFTGRRASDPPGSLESIQRIQPGLSYYNSPIGGLDLWGDFNGIALDSDDSIWMFSMYARTLHQWGTRGAKFHF